MRIVPVLLLLLFLLPVAPQPAAAQSCCTVPDNGAGTVDLPPNCPPDGYVGALRLLDGLPPGSTVEMVARLHSFVASSQPGGSLGGTEETFTAVAELDVAGTGTLAGFNRTLSVPVTGITHSAPRTPGATVQAFPIRMYRLQGILTGDYDFSLLWFEGGGIFGLPSPGHTTLTRVGAPGSDFEVHSFFDFNYRIQFEGRQESQYIEGWRGITLDQEETYEICQGQTASAPVQPIAAIQATARPNPMRAGTTISLDLPERVALRLAAYDVQGRQVRTLFDGETGARTFYWDGRSDSGVPVAAGTYFVKAATPSATSTLRIIRLP